MDTATDRVLITIQEFAGPLLADMGLELVEVQYRREGQGWVLRFFIDKEGGITIEDCAKASREIGSHLEVENLLDHAYTLEVSSPGLERPLKKREDFARFAGRLVRIKMQESAEGQKIFIGILSRIEGDSVVLTQEENEVFLDFDKITKARLMLEA